jgi:hypothetical protein
MPDCLTCDRFFRTEGALHAHCRDRSDHAYCIECQRLFSTFTSLNQVCSHPSSLYMWRTYGQSFRCKHLENSSFHRYREPSAYDSESDYDDDDDEESVGDVRCEACSRDFTDRAGLLQHLAASSKHNWCFICSRDFGSPTALAQVWGIVFCLHNRT